MIDLLINEINTANAFRAVFSNGFFGSFPKKYYIF